MWGLAVVLSAPVAAHPVPSAISIFASTAGAIDGTLVAHIEDVAHDLNVAPPQQLLDSTVARARAAAIVAMLSARVTLTVDGRPYAPEWSTTVTPLPDRQSVRLQFRVAAPASYGRVGVHAVLFPYDPIHRTFVNVYEHAAITQAILEAGRPDFEYFGGARQGAIGAVRRFVGSGVRARSDPVQTKLLFLPDLDCCCSRGSVAKRLALVVFTGFTIAHSITRGARRAEHPEAPPAWIIEPAIALGIVCVGAEPNLLVIAKPGGRDLQASQIGWPGSSTRFGFANVLRNGSAAPRVLGWSLFSFNLGVEIIGQLVVVPARRRADGSDLGAQRRDGRRVAQAGYRLASRRPVAMQFRPTGVGYKR